MTHSNLSLNHSPCEEGSTNPPDMKRTSQPTSRSLSLLDLMVELLPQQVIIQKSYFLPKNIKIGQSSYERKIMEGMLPMDREARHATVHGVAKSRTRLSH